MHREALYQTLQEHQDAVYRKMQISLIPGVEPDRILGVRTPILRELAKKLEDREHFLRDLPHVYFEENQIHSFLIGEELSFSEAIRQVEAFLPYVDNWATCDQLRPKSFRKHPQELLPHIQQWIASDHLYTVRFGIGMLMVHYLDARFDPAHLEWVASVQSEEYYVQMMIAWYFATALAKQYDAALPYISENRLDQWIHNKTIQKAVESYRITPEHKEILKQYRRK